MRVSLKTAKVKEPVLNRNKLKQFFKVKVYFVYVIFFRTETILIYKKNYTLHYKGTVKVTGIISLKREFLKSILLFAIILLFCL